MRLLFTCNDYEYVQFARAERWQSYNERSRKFIRRKYLPLHRIQVFSIFTSILNSIPILSDFSYGFHFLRPILDAFKSLTVDSPIGDIEDVASASCCRRKKDKHYRHVSITCTIPTITDEFNSVLHLNFGDSRVWHRVMSLQQLLDTLRSAKDEYILVAGNTAHGNLKSYSPFEEKRRTLQLYTLYFV